MLFRPSLRPVAILLFEQSTVAPSKSESLDLMCKACGRTIFCRLTLPNPWSSSRHQPRLLFSSSESYLEFSSDNTTHRLIPH